MEDQSHDELIARINKLRELVRGTADLLFTVGRSLSESDWLEEAEQCLHVSARLLMELEQITKSGATDE